MEVINSKTHHSTPEAGPFLKEGVESSPKLLFLLKNFNRILELESCLRKALSEDEIKRDKCMVVKVLEGGWLPFKVAFSAQKVFEEEKTFFQALSFMKCIEICQT